MFYQNFVKTTLISPKLYVGNPKANRLEIEKVLNTLNSSFAIFTEMSMIGYTAGDLFFRDDVIEEAYNELDNLLKNNKYKGIVILGMPYKIDNILLNTAFIIKGDKIYGIVPKMHIPNTRDFYEKRWFESGRRFIDKIKTVKWNDEEIPFGNLIFDVGSFKFGVEICEDSWAAITQGNLLTLNGCGVIVNLSASNDYLGKEEVRRNIVLDSSRKNSGIYIYSSSGINESGSETIFKGHLMVAQNGTMLNENNDFSFETKILEADLDISKMKHETTINSAYRDQLFSVNIDVQTIKIALDSTSEYEFVNLESVKRKPLSLKDTNYVFEMQAYALAKRIKHTNAKCVVLGISGGLDSTIALLAATKAMDILSRPRTDVIAVTMPALGTSDLTKGNAVKLIELLGCEKRVVPILNEARSQLELIGHDTVTTDVTYENTQARMRTMILMNLANKESGFVIGTGDLSELALGFCTYNGDQMSMYNVNGGILKTMMQEMLENITKDMENKELAEVLISVLNTKISPELIKGQVTEDVLGRYDINDFIIYRYLSFGDSEERLIYLIKKVFNLEEKTAKNYVSNFIKRFYREQFKRTASPDGVKILDISLSPRTDLRIPSDLKRN